jgi:hypothetical protein
LSAAVAEADSSERDDMSDRPGWHSAELRSAIAPGTAASDQGRQYAVSRWAGWHTAELRYAAGKLSFRLDGNAAKLRL